MPKLVFKIAADYEAVIRLREEISKLEAQLKKMDVNKSPAAARALETQLASTRQQMMSLVTEAGRVGAVMENDFKKKIYDASQTVNDLSEKIIAQRTVVREVQADVKRLGETYRTALKNGPIGAASKKSEYDAARKALDEERAALFGLTQEQANARLSVKKLRDEYSLFKEESGDVKDAIGDITGQMKNWIAGIAGGIGIKEFLGQMIQVRGEFENIETSLRVLLGGDSEKLSDIMSQMKEYALISPLTTKDMASALQMMIGFGIQAEDAITYLKALGDISMGDTVHFNSLALAFSQMSAAGKLMGQDLNQMINAGFNPLQQISEKTGKSIGELKDEMSKGAISAQMVQQAFIDATSEGGKFYGMASEGAKTLNGQISMLQESVDNMFNDMGQASEGVILNSIQAVTKLVENYEKVGKVIAGIIITYGVYRAATIANIVATEGWAAAATKDAVAKGAQTIATKALTVAQSALNSVIKANPYVLLATAIASVATAMWAFHDSAEATLQISNKFGEQASTTITKLNTLTSEVNGLAKGTSLRNKVMNELNGLLEEYGVQAIKEGDSIDSVNEKRKEAIELIKQEAIERDRLNNIDAGQQSYQQKLQDAQSDFLNSLKNARSGNDGAISFLSDNEEIQENAEAISTIIGSVVQENISKIAGKTGEEYEKGLNEIFDTIQDRMRAIGISERTISEVWVGGGLFSQSNIVRDYIEKVQEASEEHDRYTDAVNKAADAEKKAADSSSTYSQRIDMLAKSLQKPNDGVHQLYQNIKNLMSRYSDNTIGFTIRIGGEVPQWMNKKSLPELQKLAKQFSAIGEASKNGAFVNGKYMTQQQLLQRGADYATAAEQKQTEADRKKKELADKKEDSEKKNKNEKAIREQKRAEEQRKKAQETADKDLLALQQKNQDDEIALMQDGTQKRLAEIDNDYKKRTAEIDRQEVEFKKKNKEAGLTGLLPNGLTVQQSIETQTASGLAAFKYNQEREKIQREQREAEQQSMRDYLKEYGTYQEKRLAIIEDYNNKIAKANTEGGKLSLGKEQQKALQDLDIEAAKTTSSINELFGDMTDKSLADLRRLSEEGQNLLDFLQGGEWDADKGKGFGITEDQFKAITSNPESMKAISDAIINIRKQAEELRPPLEKVTQGLKDLFNSGNDHKRLSKSLQDITNGIQEIQQSMSFLAESFTSLGDSFGSNFLTSIGEGLNIANNAISSTLQGAQAGSLFGPVGSAVGGAVGLVSSLSSAFAAIHDKKNEKRIQRLQDQIDTLTKSYDKLGDAVEDAYSKDASGLIEDQNKLLEQQKVLIEQQIREEKDKKDTDNNRIKKWQDQIDEINKTIEENKEKAIDAIFGEDVQSAIEDFVNAYSDAWAQSEDRAKSAKDTVKDMMRQMVTESIKSFIQSSGAMDEIRKKLQEFYADNVLSGWEQEYIYNMAEDLQKQLDSKFAWADSLMTDTTSTAQSASSKGFETMSQDTGEELNGRMTAIYEAELNIANTTTEQLAVLRAIYGQIGGNIADVASESKQIMSTSYIQQNNISFPTAQLDALVAKVEGLDAKVADLVAFGADNRLSMQGVDTYIEDATKNSTKSLSLLNEIKRNTQNI